MRDVIQPSSALAAYASIDLEACRGPGGLRIDRESRPAAGKYEPRFMDFPALWLILDVGVNVK